MKHQEKNPPANPGDLLDQALASVRSELPDHETMSAAGARVWQHLSQETTPRRKLSPSAVVKM